MGTGSWRSAVVLGALAAAVVVFAPARAGEPTVAKDAAAATAAGRSLDRALDQVLGHPPREAGATRSLIILVDATRDVAAAKFADRLRDAVERKSAELANVRLGAGRVGAKGTVTVAPGTDRAAVVADIAAALADANASPIRNVYADVRAAAAAFTAGAAEREILLVTLENGDAEDDLEATVRALQREKVTCSVIARESFLADSYALSHSGMVSAPKGTTLAGGDGAWPEVPWGWLFQMQIGNEAAPSGFAAYGLTRLAAATGGQVHLYSAPGGKHQCALVGECGFCDGDHLSSAEVFEPHRVEALAPSAAARDDVLAEDAKDPWLRATLDVWAKAGKEGLLRSRPPVAVGAGGLVPEKRNVIGTSPFGTSGMTLQRGASVATKLLAAGDRLLADFEATLAKIDPSEGSPRHRANAEYTRVMFHLTLLNVSLLESWCAETGPALFGKRDAPVVPPETAWASRDDRPTGFGSTNVSLCHGIAPFRGRRMAAGPGALARLAKLESLLDAYFARYDHTPWGAAVRRCGVAQFHPVWPAKYVPPPPRNGGSSETDTADTPERPDRAGGDSGGGGGGTTTPGGK